MKTISLALAAGFGLVMVTPASAQNETRGYGGPLYVGPNFEKGGQHTTPDYGFKPSKKAAIKREVAKPRKAPASKEVATEKGPAPAERTAAPAPAAIETSAAPSAAAETAAPSGPTTCKKFVPTVGQTVTVPCE